MTQIDNINETGPAFGNQTAKTGKAQKTDAFQDALSQALSSDRSSGSKSAASSGLSELPAVGPTFMSQTEVVSGKTDKLLGLLESYTSKLSDPTISLKSMAGDAEDLKTRAGNLEKDVLALGKEDASLKAIATQTVVTAQTEYLKFQRGDYTS